MEEIISQVFNLLEKAGASDYFGESISQLDHSLQSAYLAKSSGADSEMVLAALLHDIGHIYDNKAPQMSHFGVLNHENLGGEYLLRLGFSQRVVQLVSGHVNAKRYLVSTIEAYKKNLSESSQRTLEFQGGFMSEEEVKMFENDFNFKDLLKIRAWDDQAKIVNLKVPNLESYRNLIFEHLITASQRKT